MGDSLYGECQYCGIEDSLRVTYFRFPINCECCGSTHSERIEHCMHCEAKMPNGTKVYLSTKKLLDPINEGLFQKVKE